MKTLELHDWVRHGTPRASFRTTDPALRARVLASKRDRSDTYIPSAPLPRRASRRDRKRRWVPQNPPISIPCCSTEEGWT